MRFCDLHIGVTLFPAERAVAVDDINLALDSMLQARQIRSCPNVPRISNLNHAFCGKALRQIGKRDNRSLSWTHTLRLSLEEIGRESEKFAHCTFELQHIGLECNARFAQDA
jgi:hypothetical protein